MRFNLDLPIVLECVKVKGPQATREVDLILDSGSRYTSLSREVLQDLGYDPARVTERVKLITANGVIEAPLIKGVEITPGTLQTKSVEVVAHTIPELAEVDGLLGLSFLKHFKVIMDFRTGILEII